MSKNRTLIWVAFGIVAVVVIWKLMFAFGDWQMKTANEVDPVTAVDR